MQDGSVRNGGKAFYVACFLVKVHAALLFLFRRCACFFLLASKPECELRLTDSLSLASCTLPRENVKYFRVEWK